MKTYEQKLDELKGINEALSDSELPLAQVVELYEKAQTLLAELKDELEKSKLLVESISKGTVTEA